MSKSSNLHIIKDESNKNLYKSKETDDIDWAVINSYF